MRVYGSFLVRCWLTEGAQQGETAVMQIEHIQSGATVRSGSFQDAQMWIVEACRSGKTGHTDVSGPRPKEADEPVRMTKKR